VQDGAALGEVDLLAAEHRRDVGGEIGLSRQLQEQRQGLFGDAILRIVEQDVAQAQGEFLEALRVSGEEIAHVQPGDFPLMLDQRLPGRQGFNSRHSASLMGG